MDKNKPFYIYIVRFDEDNKPFFEEIEILSESPNYYMLEGYALPKHYLGNYSKTKYDALVNIAKIQQQNVDEAGQKFSIETYKMHNLMNFIAERNEDV